MKPIVGRSMYKDLTPEDLERFMYEEDQRRAQEARDILSELFGAIGAGIVALGRLVFGHHHSGPGATHAGVH